MWKYPVILFWPYLIFQAATITATNGWNYGKIHTNLKIPVDPVELLEIDSGWRQIAFGNVSTDAVPELSFSLDSTGYIWFTDAFCRGDSFYLFNQNELLAETPSTIDDGCMTNRTNPDDAVQEGSFGHVNVNLTEGKYRIRVGVKESPFLAGKAFIRLDSEFKTPGQKIETTATTATETIGTVTTSTDNATDNGITVMTTTTLTASTSIQTSSSLFDDSWTEDSSMADITRPDFLFFEQYRCRASVGGYHIFNKPVVPSMAAYFCRKFGMQLASINGRTLVDVLRLAWDCSGEGKRFWMSKWNGKPVNGKVDMNLMVGGERGRGSIVRNPDQTDQLPFICQRLYRPRI